MNSKVRGGLSHQRKVTAPTSPINAKLFRVLFEDVIPMQADPQVQTVGPVDPAASTLPQNISLDQRVDSYLVQFERESTPNPPQMTQPPSNVPTPNLPESRKGKGRLSMMSLLFEADEPPLPPPGDDEEDPAAADDAGGGGDETDPLGGLGAPGGDPTGGGGGNGAPGAGPPPVKVPKLNIQEFATRVARLVNNYDALLDPRTTMLNRVQAYVAANYSPRMAKELMSTLQLNFGLSVQTMQGQQGMTAPPMSGAAIGDLTANPSSAGTVSSG